jgi:cytochrome c peroxidase
MHRLALALLATALAACTPAPPPAPLGLPAMQVPPDNPVTPQKAALGRKLFFDRRLSPNGTMSCAMCHVPEQGFTAHELATPVGIEGRSVRRNAPTVLNAGWLRRLFHDGREISLENQVWGPLLAANEMGNPSIFDRWRYGGEATALDREEQAGFAVFTGKGRCATCHLVGEKAALFTDHAFHNTGVGWRRSIAPAERTRVQLAPGVHAEIAREVLETFSEAPANDVGRYEITLDPKDRWAYRTPSLRNVALTAPYMHDGSLPSLEAVVEFYDRGGIDNPEKSQRLAPLGLTSEERAALVSFLKTLTGSGIEALVARARANPIGQ